MANLLVDERDQRFVLYEMFALEELCKAEKYADFSRDIFDMVLTEAQKLAVNVIFPTLVQGDREGCRLVEGEVRVPECFHRAYRLFCEGGWNAMSVPPKHGGQGLPLTVRAAAFEWFSHNFAFHCYPIIEEGAAHLIEEYGTEEQKKKYMEKMVAGEWGGTMVLTEPSAGSDVGALSTKAVRRSDGSYRIQGNKIFITGGDQDLVSNIVHPVLARVEGDPAGTKGISIFLVPKYVVNGDGGLGRRNDYDVTKIEEKMGIHGSATCVMNFGDKGDCYAELLGEERQGMRIMFQMMNEARIGVGTQGVAAASAAYLHAVQYAKDRLQGASIAASKDPEAPRVPIIQHPDVRRMLAWMKAHVESMRRLVYFSAYCLDRHMAATDEEEGARWMGLAEILTPIVKAHCSDVGFRVCETAVQVYGGYGYCMEYPVEQLLRDVKIASIYEGANGIQALDLVGRKLAMNKGAFFVALLDEIKETIGRYGELEGLKGLAADMQGAVNTIADVGAFLGRSGKEGKFLIPVGNAYPFLTMMGKLVSGWFLFWGAGVATERLEALSRQQGVDQRDAAFYDGKIATARYFIKHVLPEVDAAAKAIKSEDLSMMDMAEQSFAW